MKKIIILCSSLLILSSSFIILNKDNIISDLSSKEVALSSNENISTYKHEPLDNLSETPSNTSPQNVPLSRGGYSDPAYSQNANVVDKEVALVDWWNEGSNIFSLGTQAQVIDAETGKSFMIQRTTGTNHADVESVTLDDTEKIKEIWGGWSWDRRPIFLVINNRKYAASMSAMPHAGIDNQPELKTVSNRSGGYGTGDNLDFIKSNGMDGHIDVHFLNSTRHKDNRKDPQHQEAINKAYKS